MGHFPFLETQVEFLPNLSEELGIDIFIKRDDLFQSAGGGNKARKLQYILYKAKQEDCNALVTAGDINSNHCRATAMMAATLGMKLKLIIHNDHPENEVYSQNLKIARLCGAEIIYCRKENIASIMDDAMFGLKSDGYNPFYIWGGGHSLEGSFAYYDAVKYIKEQLYRDSIPPPEYVYFASGTGTTHAGIHVGMKCFFPDAKVCGISIAREKNRGASEVNKSILELEKYLGLPSLTDIDDVIFYDDFIVNGYESSCDDIYLLIKKIAKTDGLLLDPTYSGKAFWGMMNHISQGIIPQGSSVLFWHTGGLFNLLSDHGHNSL